MARIARRGIHGHTVETIARRILRGDVAEGETLNLTGLQDELEVSLTALREALKVLSAKGIVDARQKRGTFVRPRADWNLLDSEVIRWQLRDRHDKRMLDNLHELRRIVEPAAARLAAERATDADLAALDAALAAMAAMAGGAGDNDAAADKEGAGGTPSTDRTDRTSRTGGTSEVAVAEADLDFHRLLLAATGNELLERLTVVIEADLEERVRPVDGRAVADAVRGHRAVLTAIAARDPDAAERAVRDLFDDVEEV